MSMPIQTKTFKSGNSVAVRLPKGFDIPPDVAVEVSKSADGVVIRLIGDQAEAKRKWVAMLDRLDAMPSPPYIEKREPIEFPDRPGL